MKALSRQAFVQRWQAHFGHDVHPIAQSILSAAECLYEKRYEDTQLCWKLSDHSGFFSFAIALELAPSDGGESQEKLWHVLLPKRLFADSSAVAHAWIGREMASTSFFARELTGNNPFCLLEVTFISYGLQVEVFFGNPPK